MMSVVKKADKIICGEIDWAKLPGKIKKTFYDTAQQHKVDDDCELKCQKRTS